MLARWRAESGKQSACHASTASSAIRLATGAGTVSASDASRTKARTSSPCSGSSTSFSVENRATEDDVMSGPYAFAMGGIELARVGMSSRWTLLLAGSHEISTGIGRFNRGAFDDKLRSASRVVPAKNQQYEIRLLSEAMPDHENGSCSRGD